MKPLLAILAAALLVLLVGAVLYGRTRRRRLAQVIRALDRAGIERIGRETLTRLRESHPGFTLEDFKEAVALVDRDFRPSNEAFLSALPRGGFPKAFADYWVIDMGILFGDLVRKHSLSVSDWAQERTGIWKLKLDLGGQVFWWDPFKQAEDRFTGKTADLLLALQLVQTLK